MKKGEIKWLLDVHCKWQFLKPTVLPLLQPIKWEDKIILKHRK